MITPNIVDFTALVIETIAKAESRIADVMGEELTRLVQLGGDHPEIWAHPGIGAKGAAMLGGLSKCIALFAELWPERMNSVLASAGRYLTANPDGTVTYTAPPPSPEPEPEGGQ